MRFAPCSVQPTGCRRPTQMAVRRCLACHALAVRPLSSCRSSWLLRPTCSVWQHSTGCRTCAWGRPVNAAAGCRHCGTAPEAEHQCIAAGGLLGAASQQRARCCSSACRRPPAWPAAHITPLRWDLSHSPNNSKCFLVHQIIASMSHAARHVLPLTEAMMPWGTPWGSYTQRCPHTGLVQVGRAV